MIPYLQDSYNKRHEGTVYSANTVLSILLDRIPVINSAIDIGCGVGTWLSVLRDKGVKDIQGFDGNWVDENLLVIPKNCFKQVDLSNTIVTLPTRYDLAISLEVAEHLPFDRGELFISMLTELSDYILFSAAIPYQGGKNHINEQWHDYWVKLFSSKGYIAYDFIRPSIWNDNQIPFWYRQNILFFSKQQKSGNIRVDSNDFTIYSMPLNIVHPDLYLSKTTLNLGVKTSIRLCYQAIRHYINKKIGKDS